MAKEKKTSSKDRKAALKKHIAETLSNSFADIRESIGEKRFNRKVRRASKILASGVKLELNSPMVTVDVAGEDLPS
jgi:hypothetical protein